MIIYCTGSEDIRSPYRQKLTTLTTRYCQSLRVKPGTAATLVIREVYAATDEVHEAVNN